MQRGGKLIAENDYINFQVNGGARLVVRVTRVATYKSFAAMVKDVGVKALLPDHDEHDLEAAVHTYHSFGNARGKYAELERTWGAVAITVQPLA